MTAGPYCILGYRGYFARGRALVLGRVLRDARIGAADPNSSRWRNLLTMLKRIESDPLPHAPVRATVLGTHHDLLADDEGFVRAWVDCADAEPVSGWHTVALDLLPHPAAAASTRGLGHVLVAPSHSEFGVISDIDDTVLQSQVTSFFRAMRLMLLENARTRLPFPGVAAFYRALAGGAGGGAGNPIFYVSSSPWNLYDVVADFLDAQEIPAGPLLLRDWDIGRGLLKNHEHKAALIREIFESFPGLPFILVGDSGQEDPEIYSAIVQEHPGRVLAVYIRNVSRHPERSAAVRALADRVQTAGSTLLLADDTLTAARHAAAHGWIVDTALTAVAADAREDEGHAVGKSPVTGAEGATRAPTVIVDPQVRARDVDEGTR